MKTLQNKALLAAYTGQTHLKCPSSPRPSPSLARKRGRGAHVIPSSIKTGRAFFSLSSMQMEERDGVRRFLQRKLDAFALGACILLVLACLQISAAEPVEPELHKPDISFRHEVQHAIDKGLAWLQSAQNTNGYWSTADQPALTALALSAFMGEPSGNFQAHPAAFITNGYMFILAHAKPDGTIYENGLQNYNTSICMMALVNAHNPAYDSVLRRCRQWLPVS